MQTLPHRSRQNPTIWGKLDPRLQAPSFLGGNPHAAYPPPLRPLAQSERLPGHCPSAYRPAAEGNVPGPCPSVFVHELASLALGSHQKRPALPGIMTCGICPSLYCFPPRLRGAFWPSVIDDAVPHREHRDLRTRLRSISSRRGAAAHPAHASTPASRPRSILVNPTGPVWASPTSVTSTASPTNKPAKLNPKAGIPHHHLPHSKPAPAS